MKKLVNTIEVTMWIRVGVVCARFNLCNEGISEKVLSASIKSHKFGKSVKSNLINI